jgi:hypothetical protein
MTERDDRTAGPTGAPGEGTRERQAPAPQENEESGRAAGPTPEEAPELLGEQSDYPIAWEPEDGER